MFSITVHPPICQFFISRKSVDKSGFVDKSGESWQIGSVGDFIRAKFSSIGSNVWKYYLIFKTNKKLIKIEKHLFICIKSAEKELIFDWRSCICRIISKSEEILALATKNPELET